MNDDPNKPRHLAKLLGNVVKYIRDDKRGRIPRKPKETVVPRKVCKICVKSFDFITVKIKAERDVEAAVCENCQKFLDEGCIAIVQGTRFAFIKALNNRCADMRGKIVMVSKQVMDMAEKETKPHAD